MKPKFTLETIGPEPPSEMKAERALWRKRRWAILNPDKIKAWREKAKAKAQAKLTPVENSHRAQLRKSSWWETEGSKPIALDHCPNCGARFVMIQGEQGQTAVNK